MSIYIYIAGILGLFQNRAPPKYSLLSECLFALFLGGVATIFATWWIHPSQHDFPYFESDFLDYCYTLTTYDFPIEQSGSTYRSRLAGLSSYILRDFFGTIDAITVSSVLWTGLSFSLLYLCGKFLHSSAAGFFVVTIALTIAPLHTLGRLVNFYPTIIATLLFGCATFAFWSQKINYKRTFILGVAIGLLLLIDLRGILWATTYWIGSLFFVLTTVSRRKWFKFFLCLHIPILVAWFVGLWSYPPNTTPIEHQTSFVYKAIIWGTQHVQDKTLDGYVWGRSSLYSIIDLFVFLYEESSKEANFDQLGIHLRDKTQYDKNMNILLYYAALPSLLLLRKPYRFMTLLICVTPFALAWKGVQSSGMFQLRIYAQATPLLAILSGVSMGVLIYHNPLKLYRFPKAINILILFIVSYPLIWGHIPNSFALNSPWHPNWFAKADELNRINEMVLENSGVQIRDERLIKCYEQIHSENQPWVRTYNYGYEILQPLKPTKRKRH